MIQAANEQEFNDLLVTQGIDLIESPEKHAQLADFLINGDHSQYKISPSKILNNFLEDKYNSTILGIALEENGKRTIALKTKINTDDNRMINNMKLKNIDNIAVTAQEVGQRDYRYFEVIDTSITGRNKCSIDYRKGEYRMYISGHLIEGTQRKTPVEVIEILKTIQF